MPRRYSVNDLEIVRVYNGDNPKFNRAVRAQQGLFSEMFPEKDDIKDSSISRKYRFIELDNVGKRARINRRDNIVSCELQKQLANNLSNIIGDVCKKYELKPLEIETYFKDMMAVAYQYGSFFFE